METQTGTQTQTHTDTPASVHSSGSNASGLTLAMDFAVSNPRPESNRRYFGVTKHCEGCKAIIINQKYVIYQGAFYGHV